MRLPNHALLLTVTILALGGLAACASEDSPGGVAEKAAPVPVKVARAETAAPTAAAEAAKTPAKKPFVEPAGTGEPGALTVFADVDESVGDVPLAVQLDVDVIDGTGHPPFTYIWDFGDATAFSKEKAPKHTYEIPGSFRASVIVTDSKGETDQDYFDISADEAAEEGGVTAEQLMEMMPPGEVAPQLDGLGGTTKARLEAGTKDEKNK